MKHYFVTGATGVVGSSLVPVLLRDPEARLSLLVRAGSADELSGRLEALYKFWGVTPGDTAIRSRVEAGGLFELVGRKRKTYVFRKRSGA